MAGCNKGPITKLWMKITAYIELACSRFFIFFSYSTSFSNDDFSSIVQAYKLSHTVLRTKAKAVKVKQISRQIVQVNQSKTSLIDLAGIHTKKVDGLRVWHPRVVRGAMHSGKKWWIREFVLLYIYILFKSWLCWCLLDTLGLQQSVLLLFARCTRYAAIIFLLVRKLTELTQSTALYIVAWEIKNLYTKWGPSFGILATYKITLNWRKLENDILQR